MKTPASIAGHPIHPMLVAVPIGLWLFSFVCDLVFVFGGGTEAWRVVAQYTLVGGIAGALLAAIPGLIDLLSLPEGVKRIGVIHMGLNLSLVALLSGWLGGKMVYEHGVAVSVPGDAPSRRT